MRAFLRLLAKQMRAQRSELLGRLKAAGRRSHRLGRCFTIEDLRGAARRSVPRVVFDFIDGAAGDELTRRANTEDFQQLRIRPRALVDVGRVDSATEILGTAVDHPVLGAPTGLTGLIHHEGELAVARAVHASGSLYIASAMGSYTIEEIRAGTDGPLWFQLYPWRNRDFVRSLIERARRLEYEALVITVDVPVSGVRDRDLRNGFGIPPRITPRSLLQGLSRPRWSRNFLRHPRIEVAHAVEWGMGAGDAVSLLQYLDTQFDPGLSWSDLTWIREAWDGPIAVKGILRAADARRAVEFGADAVIVSNHGGRQLDGVPSTISCLPDVVAAISGEATVIVDGGIRRGIDVIKAIGLGAKACLVGRPLLFGLAADGQAGVERSMAILTQELSRAMALSGCPTMDAMREAGASLVESSGRERRHTTRKDSECQRISSTES